tara:strand:+ start:1956 stop:2207 length:252 start_codon:yes stop_codon:yes gene_type:complete
MNKIKKEQLETIVKHQEEASKISHEIGAYEFQKYTLLSNLEKVNNDIIEYKKVLEAEYGSVNINLEDGSYIEIDKEDVEDKKD